MSAIVTVPGGPFPAGATIIYSGRLLDGSGNGVPGTNLDTFTLSLSWFSTGVNTIDRENILNVGRGSIDALGNFAVTLNPSDTAMTPAPVGTKAVLALVLDWTFNAGAMTGRHQANLTLVALTEPLT